MAVHFHMLFLDGVYTRNKQGKTTFKHTIAPNQQELTILVHRISHRVAHYLERQGILERDEENSYLQLDGIDEDPMHQLTHHFSRKLMIFMGFFYGGAID